MKILELHKKSLAALLLALMALVMLPGCSTTEEAPADTSGGGGDACKEQCMSLDSHQQDECIVACEI